MKTKIYLRIGRQGDRPPFKVRVDARLNASTEPLRNGTSRGSRAIPTVFMALEIDVPDEAFKPATISASIAVPLEKLGTAVEVVDPLRLVG